MKDGGGIVSYECHDYIDGCCLCKSKINVF